MGHSDHMGDADFQPGASASRSRPHRGTEDAAGAGAGVSAGAGAASAAGFASRTACGSTHFVRQCRPRTTPRV